MPLSTDSLTSFEIPQPISPPRDKMMAKTRMRPNQVCISCELIQLSEISPTPGPKYRAAQMAVSNAVIEIASLMNPRMTPMITEIISATAMSMSIIGIRDVG